MSCYKQICVVNALNKLVPMCSQGHKSSLRRIEDDESETESVKDTEKSSGKWNRLAWVLKVQQREMVLGLIYPI
jgi:hypothetical protein